MSSSYKNNCDLIRLPSYLFGIMASIDIIYPAYIGNNIVIAFGALPLSVISGCCIGEFITIMHPILILIVPQILLSKLLK